MQRILRPTVWQQVLPEDVFASLALWMEGQDFQLDHRAWMHGGSGSHVAHVRLRYDTKVQDQIFKLIPPPDGATESRRVARAIERTPPAFREAHLVKTAQWSPLSESRWWIHQQEVGGGDLNEWRPLTSFIDDPAFGEHCAVIVKSVLVEWNDRHSPPPETTTASGFLQKRLADHLKERGGLRRFAQETEFDLDAPPSVVQIPGRSAALPNPFALLRGVLGARQHIEITLGRAHGDLHADNILIPETDEGSEPARYKLLDLSRFEDDAPLARDPMKLVLSVAALWLPSLVVESSLRSCLAELVVSPNGYPRSAPVAGYAEVSQKIHRASEALARQQSATHDWKLQKLLVLIMTALRFVARQDFGMADRIWFFEVAALATREFLDPDHGRDRGRTSPTRRQPVPDRGGLTLVRPETTADLPASPDSQPEATIIPLPLKTSQPVDEVPRLLVELLHGIKELPLSSSDARLAFIAAGLCKTARRLGEALALISGTGPVQRELRGVTQHLQTLTSASNRRRTVPELRAAGDELRRYADQRWALPDD
ncbi:hypothetical protein [Lentzea sp. NPDC059081]|uniref:hypothetical protein n=1 Tax=Lentzea sp. NPDC059081 TaxID=3346719 RepID=UPI00369939A2